VPSRHVGACVSAELTSPTSAARVRDPSIVLISALVGAILIGLSVVGWGAWILSSDLSAVPTGPDPISTPALLTLRALEVGGLLAVLYVYWRFAYRPWRAEGRLTGDGLILLALPLVWFWDPFFNYTQNVFTYNAHLLNLGSWSSQLPAWVSPHQDRFPEPFVVGFSYVFWTFGFMLQAGWIFDRIKRRWPTISTFNFLLVAYLVCAVLDGVGELSGLWLGWFAYPGSPDGLSLFDSSRFKYSLFSPLIGGLQLFLWVSVRYFRDADGLSLLERGVHQVTPSTRRQTALRFLAIYTALTFAVLIVNLGFNLQAEHSSRWSRAVPSYLTTTCPDLESDPSACGGPGISIQRTDGD
jgi:hypothetical protein